MRPLLLLLLCCGPLAADWDEVLKRFEKEYRADTGAQQRKAALIEVAKQDVPQAAALLFKVWRKLERQATQRRKELFETRGRIRDATAKLRDLRLRAKGKREALANELEGLKVKDTDINTRLAALEIEQAAIVQGIRAMRAPATISWLAANGLGPSSAPVLVRAAGDAIAAAEGAGPQALLAALERLKAPAQVIPLLQSLEGKAGALGDGLPVVLKQLSHRDWAVRIAAAFVVAKSGRPEGVAALVRQIGKETRGSRAQHELGRALQILTGKKLGSEPEYWAAWWRDNEAQVMAGKVLLGQGRPQLEKSDQGRFYGIPQVARRIVYVLDTSGSMEVSLKNPRFLDGNPIPAKDTEDSRFDAAMRELVKATGSLSPDARYAVVVYSDHAQALVGDDLLPATAKNHERFKEALRRTGPQGVTNIYEALDLALRIANVHPESQKGPSKADVVYLISDGSPTDPKGEPEDPERILQAVRSWNALRRVAIHAIGIGREHNSAFLQELARENGGEYYAVGTK